MEHDTARAVFKAVLPTFIVTAAVIFTVSLVFGQEEAWLVEDDPGWWEWLWFWFFNGGSWNSGW